MGKKVILAFLVGWAFAFLIAPRDVLGFIKPRSA